MGGLVGYIDSTDVAFDGREMGVFMVLMAILGGKGTLWGPVIGATLFHFFKEGLWTLILGWQYVALGVLIVVIVVYFPEGLMGWLREKYPERFGEVVDEAALIQALDSGKLAGAALDVRSNEPPTAGPLEQMENVILTPHIAAFTEEAQERVVAAVCQDVAAVLQGQQAQNAFNFSRPVQQD